MKGKITRRIISFSLSVLLILGLAIGHLPGGIFYEWIMESVRRIFRFYAVFGEALLLKPPSISAPQAESVYKRANRKDKSA